MAPEANPSPARVVVIGLDMGDGALIRHWAQSGALPHLQALIERGSWFDLDSPAQVLHTSTWPSFATGALPGRHGVYYPFQPQPGHQQAQHVSADRYGMPSFWRLADRAGRRCIVYDVPETFAEPGFQGRAVFEWGTWAWYGERNAQPLSLLAEIKSRFGDYPLGMEAMRLGLGKPSQSMLEQRLPQCIDYKRSSLQWLMEQGGWDLIVTAFCETHPAAHYLWPAGARDVAGTEATRFRPILSVYRAVDRAIGALRAALPPDTHLMIVSGDGVRPNNAGWHLLPAMLEKLGYVNAGGGEEGGQRKPRSLLGTVKAMLPPRARRLIADMLPWQLRNKIGASLEPAIDWAHTRAFTLPTDLEGCIRINLRGREPQGIVAPGAEYKALCAELRDRLSALVNTGTGKPAVSKVWVRDEVFPGDRRDQLPDIVVSWNDAAPITGLAASGVAAVEGPSPDPRTGTHSTSGFLLACGPGVTAGRRARAQLVQVAPTVLNLLGCGGEQSFDGAPLDLSSTASH